MRGKILFNFWFLFFFILTSIPINSAFGADNDFDGVPNDSDSDGVPNDSDSDGVPNDSDSDGVTNDKDHCPNLQEDYEAEIDGCPSEHKIYHDSDYDGIEDLDDLCPELREIYNQFQDLGTLCYSPK